MVREVFNVTEDSFSVKSPELIKTIKNCIENERFCEFFTEFYIPAEDVTVEDVLNTIIEEGIVSFRESGIKGSKRYYKSIRRSVVEKLKQLEI